MMRVEDTWRSIKRMLSFVFADPWTIRLEPAQYAEEERPLIILETVGELTRTGVQPTIPSRQHVLAQTFLATAYPHVPDDPREAREAADMVLGAFEGLVNIGWIEDDVSLGGPLRLPLWDYEGVPLDGPDRGNPYPADQWYAMAWVDSASGVTLPDPEDDRRYTVPYTMRLSWDVTSRYDTAPIAQHFGGSFDPTLVVAGESFRPYPVPPVKP
jgi:hypothetical protein